MQNYYIAAILAAAMACGGGALWFANRVPPELNPNNHVYAAVPTVAQLKAQ